MADDIFVALRLDLFPVAGVSGYEIEEIPAGSMDCSLLQSVLSALPSAGFC